MAMPTTEIHIGGQTRTLRVDFKCIRIAHKLLGRDPRAALLTDANPAVICDLLACALIASMGDKADANRVGVWMSAEPERYLEFYEVTAKVYEAFYEATGVIEKSVDADKPKGGESAPR